MVPTAAPSQTEIREKILDQAEQLFRHYGYAKTTMADIAEGCKMSPANLYRFFASKSALVEGICCKVTRMAEQRLLTIVNSDASASRRLELFIAQMHQNTLENLLDHRKVHEMVLVAMEENWSAIKEHLGRVCTLIERLIREGMASGEFEQQDPVRTARTVQASLVCLCHPAVVAQKLEDENRAKPDELAAFVIRSLKARI